MLERLEKKVMLTLCNELKDKDAILISPIDLLKIVGAENLSISRLERIVGDLSTDGYFDLVYSDRRGETIYCISILEKGKGYLRSEKQRKRNLLARLFFTIGFAIVSFLVGLILKKIF